MDKVKVYRIALSMDLMNKNSAQQWRAAIAASGIHFSIREWPIGQTLQLLAGPLCATS